MADKISVEIVTPEVKLYSDVVSFVSCPAAGGEIGILPMHEPFVSSLRAGSVRIKQEASRETHSYVIAGGYVEVKDDKVLILADRACDLAELDGKLIKENLERIQAQLTQLDDQAVEFASLKEEEQWHLTQLRFTV